MKTVTLEDGHVFHLNTVRKWKGLEVIEVNLPEGIEGLSVPCDPGTYRILINSENDEQHKLATFIHEMIHLYRGDHEKEGVDINQIEAECHQLTHEVMEALNL